MKNSKVILKATLLLLITSSINFYCFADDPQILRSGFIKNAGQVYDMSGDLCPNVLYSLQLNKATIFVTTAGLSYGMATTEEKTTRLYRTWVRKLP